MPAAVPLPLRPWQPLHSFSATILPALTSAAVCFWGVLSSEQPISATDKNMASSRCFMGGSGLCFVGISLVIPYSRPEQVMSKSVHQQDEQQQAAPHQSEAQNLGGKRHRLRWRVDQVFRQLPTRHQTIILYEVLALEFFERHLAGEHEDIKRELVRWPAPLPRRGRWWRG